MTFPSLPESLLPGFRSGAIVSNKSVRPTSRMTESSALELVLPWLTAQELASVASVNRALAAAVRQVTWVRSEDVAQGKEKWKVPVFNQVDACRYPYFQYTRHSVVFSPSPLQSRNRWGSLLAEPSSVVSESTASSPDRLGGSMRTKSKGKLAEHSGSSEVEKHRQCDVLFCNGDAVGCSCSEDCAVDRMDDVTPFSGGSSREECRITGIASGKRKVGMNRDNDAVPSRESLCRCGRLIGGELAYDRNSRLRVLTEALETGYPSSESSLPDGIERDLDEDSDEDSEIDEGPPLVMECGSGCACRSWCALRVSQHGLAVRVSLVRSPLKGWCLHAAQFIAAGSFLCEYAGELLPTKEAKQRQKVYEETLAPGRRRHGPALLILKEHLPSGRACLRVNVDGTSIGNVARFINHSCDGGNLYPCLIRAAGSFIPKLGFFARRNILDGDELSYCYGADTTDGAACRPCFCGSPVCQGILPSEAT